MSIARPSRSVLLIAAVTLASSTAWAQVDVPLTGNFGNNRGPFIDFPAVGETPCPSLLINRDFGPFGTTSPGAVDTADAFGIPNPQVAHPNGCIRGVGSAAVTGSNPAAFELGAYAFQQAPPPTGQTNQVDPNVPNVLSVQTRNGITGPPISPNEPISVGIPPAPATNPAAWRNFRAGAWTTQTGRVGPDFTWCWGVAGNCGTPASPGTVNDGTQPAVVKYRGGPNRFGGTMALILIQEFGQLALTSGPAVPPGGVALLPLGAGGAPFSIPEGRGYSVYDLANLPSAPVYSTYTVTPTYGFLGGVGNQVGTIPPATNKARGFPWTTGTVFVRNTGTQGGNPATQTLSAVGSDNRTPLGLTGNITLVAGSITSTLLAGNISNTPNLANIRLNFLPEPGAALQAASGVLALFGLQLWRSRRRG